MGKTRYVRTKNAWRDEVRRSGQSIITAPDGDSSVLHVWHAMSEPRGWQGVYAFAVKRRLPGDILYIGAVGADNLSWIKELHDDMRAEGWSTSHHTWAGTIWAKILPIPVDRGEEVR